jgi:hypothetical protein
MLEQLGSSKEQRCRLLSPERFTDIEQVNHSRKERPAFPWTYWGLIKDAGLLDDGCLVVVVRAETALVLLFRRKGHGEGSHLVNLRKYNVTAGRVDSKYVHVCLQARVFK